MNIYALTSDIQSLQEMLETEENVEVIQGVLEGYEKQLEEKAEAYAMVNKNLEALEKGLKEEADRLTQRAKVIANNRKRLKENLQEAMIKTGKRKFKTSLFGFNIQKNPPSCKIIGDVPKEFLIEQEPKIDKKAILELLKTGETLDYAEIEQGESLRIR